MKKNKLNYINIGCGNRYHSDWINIDIKSKDPNVIEYNILKGIPFEDDSLDVVYHSHVLEHFTKENGMRFINECYRVLKPGGIIRVVVPDLEGIIKEYQKLISDESGNINHERYNWIIHELYDQTMRNRTGGEMKEFILSGKESEYILNRIGEEGVSITNDKKSTKSIRKRLYKLKQKIFDFFDLIPFVRFYRLGKFRHSGEIHYCMYDRHSLSKLLLDCNFRDIRITDSISSSIPGWIQFNLDFNNGRTLKPDSLFVEAIK